MKKGISIWAFSEKDLEKCFRTAKRCGYEGVELSFDEAGAISPDTPPAKLLEIRETAENCGISLYSLASGVYWNHSLTADDPAVRKKAETLVKKQLDAAAVLGCDTILVLAGMVAGLSAAGPVVSYDDAYDRSLKALSGLALYAEERRVKIGIENVWNKFLLSPIEMRDFIDKIKSPWVGAYFDVGNVVRDGFPEQWIRILGRRIVKVHFKDYKRSIGTLDGFVELLAGDADYGAVMQALREIGYDGWVTPEVFPYISNSGILLENTSNAIDYILKNM
ncbi:MAG: sugar phosphate isomerase/epimerase family protein [Clostridia bacterium]